MSRLLALDIGRRRSGLAVSDELGLTARPLEIVPTDRLSERLVELTAEFDPEAIIVGRPRRLGGELGEQADLTEHIVNDLRSRLPIVFRYEDESATNPPDGADDQAACVILQGYLDEHRHS